MSSEAGNPSVERALLLLEILLEHPQGAELPELLARVDISRSSLFVLLNTLKALGYVEQAEKRGRYRAGPRLLAWRAGRMSIPSLETAFYQEASALNLAETLALVVPTASGGVLSAQVEGTSQVRVVFAPGRPFGAESAAGQVLLTAPSEAVLCQGYALVQSDDSVDLALPICRDGRTPSAALLLSAPAFRWRDQDVERFLPPLREMAARLSYRLGAMRYRPWQGPSPEAPIVRKALSAEEIAAFLAGPWIARLACVRPDGSPHVVPVWQEWDGRYFYLAAWQGSLWAGYVLANPLVSLTVDEPWPPLRRVLARGRAIPLESAELPGELNGLLHRLRRRYLGQSSPLPTTEWRAFRITPDTLTAWQGLA